MIPSGVTLLVALERRHQPEVVEGERARPSPAWAISKVGLVPIHSGSIVFDVQVQRTVDGAAASSTCMTQWPTPVNSKRTSPSVRGFPVTSGVHQPCNPRTVVNAVEDVFRVGVQRDDRAVVGGLLSRS